jgi:hypothetical protein
MSLFPDALVVPLGVFNAIITSKLMRNFGYRFDPVRVLQTLVFGTSLALYAVSTTPMPEPRVEPAGSVGTMPAGLSEVVSPLTSTA